MSRAPRWRLDRWKPDRYRWGRRQPGWNDDYPPNGEWPRDRTSVTVDCGAEPVVFDEEIVPGATHLFEEPGTLERVAALAAEWFGRHL